MVCVFYFYTDSSEDFNKAAKEHMPRKGVWGGPVPLSIRHVFCSQLLIKQLYDMSSTATVKQIWLFKGIQNNVLAGKETNSSCSTK